MKKILVVSYCSAIWHTASASEISWWISNIWWRISGRWNGTVWRPLLNVFSSSWGGNSTSLNALRILNSTTLTVCLLYPLSTETLARSTVTHDMAFMPICSVKLLKLWSGTALELISCISYCPPGTCKYRYAMKPDQITRQIRLFSQHL